MNEWMNEWTNERMSEWMNEWLNEQTKEEMNKKKEWVNNQKVNEWTNAQTNDKNNRNNHWFGGGGVAGPTSRPLTTSKFFLVHSTMNWYAYLLNLKVPTILSQEPAC